MHSRIIAGLFSASLVLCADLQPAQPATMPKALADFTSFALVRLNQGSPTAITAEQAANALKDYDVIFIGEFHDHIANHLAEMALLRALQERAPKLALSMEQFERDQQSRADDYLAGKIGEESLTSGLAWKNYAEAYRPLIEFAKDKHLPVIAANAPQAIVRCIGKEGIGFLARLPAGQRSLVATELHAADGPYKQSFSRFAGDDTAHGGKADAGAKQRIDNNFAAQVARDDTMAESIANFLNANPGYRVLHVTGAFHAEERLGTVERLQMRSPQLKIALVMPVQVARDSPGLKPEDAKGADFAILLQREPEPYVTDKERDAADAKEAERFRAAQNTACRS